MNILVTGCNGQLGLEIKEISKFFLEHSFLFQDIDELNISDFGIVHDYVNSNKIDLVINCAAYTNVEKAEEDFDEARLVNTVGVSNLVDSLLPLDGKIIHISTDYVFDGKNKVPYKENDDVNPLNNYAKTKLSGELKVLNSKICGVVIRTSWLYSSFGNNFLNKILSLSKEQDELRIVSDQYGTPTYARDLAEICMNFFVNEYFVDDSKRSDIFHYSNSGCTTWFEFAKEIKKLSGFNSKIVPATSENFLTKAKRPKYSVLDTSKIKKISNCKIPNWDESLSKCLSINNN